MVALLAFCCVTVLRLLGVDGNHYTVPALALTPYFGAAALPLAVLCFVLRRRVGRGTGSDLFRMNILQHGPLVGVSARF